MIMAISNNSKSTYHIHLRIVKFLGGDCVKSSLMAFVLPAILSSPIFRRNFQTPIVFPFFLTQNTYLPKLYEVFRWPVPKNPVEERAVGEQLLACLWRGSEQAVPECSEPS
jgi:hypothetical protein